MGMSLSDTIRDMPQMKAVAFLRQMRDRLNMKQGVVAEALGVPVSYVSEIENGKRDGGLIARYASFLEPLLAKRVTEKVHVEGRRDWTLPCTADGRIVRTEHDGWWIGDGPRIIQVSRETAERLVARGSHIILDPDDPSWQMVA